MSYGHEGCRVHRQFQIETQGEASRADISRWSRTTRSRIYADVDSPGRVSRFVACFVALMSANPSLSLTAWLRFDAIQAALDASHPTRVLEIGAGEGALAELLGQRFDYIGVEPDACSRAVAVGRVGGERMVTGLPESGIYDLICAFEVLEHIEDDLEALVSWKRLLRSGGHLLLSVPAHQRRFGPSDDFVGHYRRYDRNVLVKLLDGAGFEPTQWTTYGVGLGQALERARNAILSRRLRPATAEATAGSGRLFQPKSRARALGNFALAVPFRIAQRPFANTEHGMGYVVLAKSRS